MVAGEHEVEQLHRVPVLFGALQPEPAAGAHELVVLAPGGHGEIRERRGELGRDLTIDGFENLVKSWAFILRTDGSHHSPHATPVLCLVIIAVLAARSAAVDRAVACRPAQPRAVVDRSAGALAARDGRVGGRPVSGRARRPARADAVARRPLSTSIASRCSPASCTSRPSSRPTDGIRGSRRMVSTSATKPVPRPAPSLASYAWTRAARIESRK